MPADARSLDTRLHRQRTAAAGAAVALSLGIHLALYVLLSRVGFQLVASRFQPLTVRRVEAMHLTDVQGDPLDTAARPPPLAAGDTSLSPDLAVAAEELSTQPDVADVEPPPLAGGHLAAEAAPLTAPSAVVRRDPWETRPDILQIEKRLAADDAVMIERREVPPIPRSPQAPEITITAERTAVGVPAIGSAARLVAEHRPAPVAIVPEPRAGTAPEAPALRIGESHATEPSELYVEEPAEVTEMTPIERVLTARIETHTGFWDRKYGYFRLQIERAGADLLPVLPKDIVLVQDASASITAQRLHFCREGLLACLDEIGPADRFNVVAFRDRARLCFPGWVPASSGNVARAAEFVGSLRAEGNTDIFRAAQALLEMERTPGRPVICILVTDGLPTAGLTASSAIIGEFTGLNDGALSVFTFGTKGSANAYLLDLLSYCNRGGVSIVKRGRWDIPGEIVDLARSTRRPVMSDVHFRFAGDAGGEVYPVLSSNLYLDRPLVLHGRYPRGARELVFQAVGRAGELEYDMIFKLDVAEAAGEGGKDIRTAWARQKIYHLIGRHARSPDPALLREIRRTAKDYGVAAPYRGRY